MQTAMTIKAIEGGELNAGTIALALTDAARLHEAAGYKATAAYQYQMAASFWKAAKSQDNMRSARENAMRLGWRAMAFD